MMQKIVRRFIIRHPLFVFIIRRIASMIPILFIISFALFFFMSLAPGDFFSSYYQDANIKAEVIDHYRREFGLDQPFYIQYALWLKKVIIDHDLGMSFSYRMPILELLNTRIWNTVFLNVFSLLFSFVFSYPLAFYFAYKPRKLLDKAVSGVSLLLYSMPGFFLALLGLLFAAKTGLFPLGGATSEQYESLPFFGRLIDRLHHILLPVLIGFISGMAGSLRSMKELLNLEFQKPYITAVRAKGVRKWGVIKHSFRNALTPFVTGLSGLLAGLFSGSVITEIIFSYPGVGLLMYDATLKHDYFLVLTNMIVSSVLALTGILISDILLALVDPRVRMK